jgi:hypothetical protein
LTSVKKLKGVDFAAGTGVEVPDCPAESTGDPPKLKPVNFGALGVDSISVEVLVPKSPANGPFDAGAGETAWLPNMGAGVGAFEGDPKIFEVLLEEAANLIGLSCCQVLSAGDPIPDPKTLVLVDVALGSREIREKRSPPALGFCVAGSSSVSFPSLSSSASLPLPLDARDSTSDKCANGLA